MPIIHHQPFQVSEYPLEFIRQVAERNISAIQERQAPLWPRLEARARAILHMPSAQGTKVRAMWKLADELLAPAEGNVGCRRGCSHCCHIAVGVFEHEAKVIATAAGRALATPRGRTDFSDIVPSYSNPCPFLRDGECSIYEHRPMTCRTHLSLFQDDSLCRLREDKLVEGPYYDGTELRVLIGMVGDLRPGHAPKMADVREWFPAQHDEG